MSFLRQMNAALNRLADRMQGQEVERESAVGDDRRGGEYAAMMRSRYSQGTSALGHGR